MSLHLLLARAKSDHSCLGRIVPSDEPMADSLVVRKIKNARQKKAQTTSDETLIKWLGHISANPGRSDDTYLLRESYVYATQTGHINSSPESVRAFLQLLISAAQRERVLSLRGLIDEKTWRNANVQNGRIIASTITGDRGIGKTIFFNHLLSKYAKDLDDARVVWVRINLTQNVGLDGDIEHWILAQITKVLLRYYEETSTYPKFGGGHRAPIYAKCRATLQTIHEIEILDNLQYICSRTGHDEPFSPAVWKRNICKDVFLTARKEFGLSFIVVLDGLDQMEADEESNERYRSLVQASETFFEKYPAIIAGAQYYFGATFAIASRDDVVFKNWQHLQTFNSASIQAFTIGEPEIDEVLDRRLKSILGYCEAAHSPDDTVLLEVKSRASDFMNAYRIDVENKRFERDYLDSFGSNVRQKLYAIQSWFIAWRSDEPRGYQLIELLARAGWEFVPVPYFLRSDSPYLKIGETTERYDARLLVNLLRPPLINTLEFRSRKEVAGIGGILLQYRILQIIDQIERFQYSMPQLATVLGVCLSLFGYESHQASAAVRQLHNFGAVFCGRSQNDQLELQSPLRLTKQGERLLNTTIFQPAYLNLCSMRTPLASKLVSELISPLSHVRPISQWVETKLRNSLLAMCVILAINSRQEGDYKKKRSKLTAREIQIGDSVFRALRVGADAFEKTFSRIPLDETKVADIVSDVARRIYG